MSKQSLKPEVRLFISTFLACLALASLIIGVPTLAQSLDPETGEPRRDRSPNNPQVEKSQEQTAPSQSLQRTQEETANGSETTPTRFPNEVRTIDGTGNNLSNPSWGSAGVTFLRRAPVDYADGKGTPSGTDRPSAREVSNAVVAQAESIPNRARATDFVWQWGQFLDHDLDLTPEVHPEEAFDIAVPQGDLWFDPFNSGTVTIPLNRSLYEVVDEVYQQNNLITAFIDASNVYGSDTDVAQELRTLDGTGRLATSPGNLLPFNVNGLPNAAPAGSDPADFFLAGDFRANEQVGLTAMHTLFMREHNFWADRYRGDHPNASGDEVYEYARAMVAAEMQVITYNEFLPILLGQNALPRYRGYKPEVDPGISNTFATASYRFGHTMLSSTLQRLDANGQEISAGHLSLADGFFQPGELVQHGIAPLLRGLAAQRAQEIDNYLVDEVRNFLFGPPGSGGFDLASLNIQRGRDHGLPSYNQVRRAFGLRPARNFADVNPDPDIQARLSSVYDSVNDIDAWVGGLAEPRVRGALVGETVRTVLIDQFTRLRDGDRFWYKRYLPENMIRRAEAQSLARIVRRNTPIGTEFPENPFLISNR